MTTSSKAMGERNSLYLGRAGQLAVMSEFVARGWNAAIPEVDVGDDILVIRDEDGSFSRIQVKSSSSTPRSYGYSARFHVPTEQLRQPQIPELTYVFAVRHEEKWTDFVVIRREELFDLYELHDLGGKSKKGIILTLQFEKEGVICSKVDFSPFLNDFSAWPFIDHR